MTLKHSTIALAAAAAVFATAASADDAMMKPSFAVLDTNADGVLSAAEVAAANRHRDALRKADANGDGRIDRSEFDGSMAKPKTIAPTPMDTTTPR